MVAATATSRRRKKIIIPHVHIFTAGPWKGYHYRLSDLDDMVRNFAEFSSGPNPLLEVPFIIGHEEDQDFTGIPAMGWVKTLEREGRDLFGDVEQIFPSIARLVEAGAYRHVSPEIYPPDSPPEGVPIRGCALRRLAALGGQLPHIKQLADMPDPIEEFEEFADYTWQAPPPSRLTARRAVWQSGSRTWACYAEVTRMADTAMRDAVVAAIRAKMPDLSEDFLASLDDDQLTMLAGQGSEGGTATPPAEEPAPAAMDDMGMGVVSPDAGGAVIWPEGMDRQAVEQALVAEGEDPAALQAMSDQDLLDLWEKKKGAPMSEAMPWEVDAVTTPTQTQTQTPAAPAQPKKVVTATTQHFSEAVRAEARALVAQETAGLRAELAKERASRQANEKASRGKLIQTFCEVLVKEGRVMPADVEHGKDGKPIGPVALSLWHADAVRKFSDGKSALEQLMDAYARRAPVRRFGELVADPIQQAAGAMTAERREHLLSLTPKGKAVLAKERTKKQEAVTFAEAMATALKGRLGA